MTKKEEYQLEGMKLIENMFKIMDDDAELSKGEILGMIRMKMKLYKALFSIQSVLNEDHE